MLEPNKKTWQYILLATLTSATVVICSVIGNVYRESIASPPTLDKAQPKATLVSHQKQQSFSSEELGRRCFPTGVSNAVFMGEFEDTHETFQLWQLTIDSRVFLRVNTLFGEMCGLAFDGRYDRIFSDQVSMNIAQRLELLAYQHSVELVGGVAALEDFILEELNAADPGGHNGGPSYFSPEQIWALEQLGIYLPEGSYKLIEPILPNAATL